jgi:hypothetical protein
VTLERLFWDDFDSKTAVEKLKEKMGIFGEINQPPLCQFATLHL